MATSKVNHNSGIITIAIVILLSGVAIFSGQFIPSYFGGNVIGGGPGGGGSFGGGSGILKTSFDLDWKDSFDFSTNSVFDEQPNYYTADISVPIPTHPDDITLALTNGAGMIFYDPAVKSCSDIALSSYNYGDGIQFSLRPIGSPTWLNDVCIADEAGRVFALELVNIDLSEIAHLRFWEVTASLDYCVGTATACNSLGVNGNPSACERQAGCQEYTISGITGCIGTAATCSTFGEQNTCTNQAGCSWLVCQGTDGDSDGYFSAATCGSVFDCNDNNANVNPQAPEVCGDGLDNDCSGGDLACAPTDTDGDTYLSDVDCNDNNANIHPGVPEVCDDGADNDCNGETDAADSACDVTGAQDDDDDGVEDALDVCPNTPAGQSVNSNGCADSQIDGDSDTYMKDVDCNDNNVNIHPGVTEVCGDGIDQDCSGADSLCSGDDDGDGVINANDLCSGTSAGASVNANGCSDAQIDNDGDTYTEAAGDCNDNNAAIKPGATDICGDGIDQDCTGGDLVCGTSGGSGSGGGSGAGGGAGTTSGGSQQTGTSKTADEPKLDTSKKYFDVNAPVKDQTDYFGLSMVAILGSALAVLGYLRYFKPELAKKLFGSKTSEKKPETENSNGIGNLFKNIADSFRNVLKKK